MPPVPVERLVKALEKLKEEMDAGRLRSSEYDQRLARVIGEMRDQGIAADRAGITAVIDDALTRGIITPSVKKHLENKLGLT